MGLAKKNWFFRLEDIINMNGTIFLGQHFTDVHLAAQNVSLAESADFRDLAVLKKVILIKFLVL